MNKFIVLFAVLVTVAVAQKPFYAQGGTGIQLAWRFRDRTTDNVDLNNRVGEGSTTTVRLPVDALGDADLVNQISKWPRDKQPFWFINSQQIEEHRNTQQPQFSVQSRGSFQGPRGSFQGGR